MPDDPFSNLTRESVPDHYHQGRRMFGGRYTLVRRLGKGGMGEVWLAQDNELGEPRALKFAPTELAGDARSSSMLKREAIAGTSLAHENIVRIFDFAHEPRDGECAVVMEYVDGKSLADLLAERIESGGTAWFEAAEIEQWWLQAAAGLSHAHAAGRAHRDLKPHNLLIETTTQKLKITDFGISRRIGDSLTMLTGKDSSGTLPYMSPQQLNGDTPSASDDIYSLGATFYDLLTGGPPFFGGAVEKQIIEKQPPPILTRRQELHGGSGQPIPACWQQLIFACLEKEPHKRLKNLGKDNTRVTAQNSAEPISRTWWRSDWVGVPLLMASIATSVWGSTESPFPSSNPSFHFWPALLFGVCLWWLALRMNPTPNKRQLFSLALAIFFTKSAFLTASFVGHQTGDDSEYRLAFTWSGMTGVLLCLNTAQWILGLQPRSWKWGVSTIAAGGLLGLCSASIIAAAIPTKVADFRIPPTDAYRNGLAWTLLYAIWQTGVFVAFRFGLTRCKASFCDSKMRGLYGVSKVVFALQAGFVLTVAKVLAYFN